MSHSDSGPVVVTGGSRGIGAATVMALARAGRPVAFSYASNDQAAQDLVARVSADGGRAVAVKGDVAEMAAIETLFQTCEREFGQPTGVFANAGITGPAGRFETLPPETLRRVLDVNIIGAGMTVQAATRAMSKAHGGSGGAIVMMSSRAAALGGGNEWIHYAASKGAINSMTVGFAKELGADGIRVNAVAPGLIDTEIHAAAGLADRLQAKAKDVPLGRIGTAEEVAEAVKWLLSDAASYVSGAILDISAGR
ncbi:SDR family oxidoreductase [Roseovarius gahaiensis]|uniref:SDR family oxidoreductase n=1 Tax=Roseovarius gahaiensis TaxID=2716691 RepID=A0A967EFC9_9RHOB|nr:SDR family oxidoreductase [Roseovarius gahaiensis]NHQ75243.1 SDR family oxidoreductase [Roseovarius gahaiensis]